MKSFKQHLDEAEKKDPFEAQRRELASILKSNKPVTRAILMGLTPACSRCGGSGTYSFNLKDGTVCYGCSGNKHVVPKNRAQWDETVDAAKRAAADGRLTDYIDSIAIRKEMSKLSDAWFTKWKASGVDNYKWHNLGAYKEKALAHLGVGRQTNGMPYVEVTNWSMLELDEIRQVFLSDINAYYANISNFFGDVSMMAEGIKKAATSEQYTEWLNALAEMKNILYTFETKLHALVAKVPSLVAEAKKGRAFLASTNKGRYMIEARWVADYVSCPNLETAKITKLTQKYTKTQHFKWMTWPHES